MRNYRDRRTRYKHFAGLWLLILGINLVLFWFNRNWWQLVCFLLVTPPIFAIWEHGERERDRWWSGR